jgi:hypothetical protein
MGMSAMKYLINNGVCNIIKTPDSQCNSDRIHS